MKPVTASPAHCHMKPSCNNVNKSGQCESLLLWRGTRVTGQTEHHKAGLVASVYFNEQSCQFQGLPFPPEY